MLTRELFNPVPNRRFAIGILVLTTRLIFPLLTTICRFREMDAFASSVNEGHLLMEVSPRFSSIASSGNIDEASAILIWSDRTG